MSGAIEYPRRQPVMQKVFDSDDVVIVRSAMPSSVAIETWRRWEDACRAAGMRFYPAPEYQVFPTAARPLTAPRLNLALGSD